MDTHNETLCKGLRLMYWGTVISIVAALCAVASAALPPLALLLLLGTIAAATASIVGLVKLRNEHADYQKALIALVVTFICGLFARSESGFANVMGAAQDIASLLQTYFVIRATNSFLRERDLYSQAEQGDKAWKWTLITTVIAIATGALVLILAAIDLALAAVGAVLLLLALIFSLYPLILYLGYLRESSQLL